MKQPEKIQLPRKPHYVTITTQCDFFELFKKIELQFEQCFYLESLGEDSHISRYSIIGFDPEKLFYANGKQLTIEDRNGHCEHYPTENPYKLLQSITPQNIVSRKYAGGLTGYLGYDSMNYFEPSLNIQNSEMFDAFRFGLFKDGCILDGELTITPVKENMTRDEHREAVLKVKQDIIEGKIFQTEVGFKKYYKLEGDTINIYEQLRNINPSPQMYYVKFGEQKLIGASPELLKKSPNTI